MAAITIARVRAFLTEVSQRYQQPATLLLLGGSALCLLGSTRATLDIDYVGHDLHKDALQQVIDQVAEKMRLDVEAVPIDEFVPLPEDAQTRQLPFGAFGTIEVFILDPYTIALSKLDRGFDTDLEDVLFLLHQELIQFEQLESVVETAIMDAQEFALDPDAMRERLQVVWDQF